MARIPINFDLGEVKDMTTDDLLRYIQKMYTTLALAINSKPSIIQRDTDGQPTDTFLSNGDLNINTSTLKVEMLTEHSSTTTVQWTQLS